VKKKKKKKQAVASWERMRSVRKMQHVLGPRHTTDETRYDKIFDLFRAQRVLSTASSKPSQLT